MKDIALIFLFKLSRFKWIDRFYTLYYKFAIKFLKLVFSQLKFVEQVGLKGSFGKIYFVPVFSDLDFFIVGNKNTHSIKKLEFVFKYASILFPIIKDYDFYSKKEAELLLTLGDLKFIEADSWTSLKGESFHSDYRYHPRKFYLDIVHEVHFQFEWLFRNLKLRKPGDAYKSLNMQRQYDKVSDLLNYLHDHQSYPVKRRPFKPNYRWVDYSNEYIIEKFNNLLKRSVQLRTLKKVILREFHGRAVDPILKQRYFQENLELVDSGFTYTGKSHYFTKDNFELFYYSGAIDSFLVYDWARENPKDKLGCFFIRAQYYCRLIEGRYNSKHGKDYLKKQLPDFVQDCDYITSTIPHYESPPSNMFGKKVVLRAFEASKQNGYAPIQEVKETRFKVEGSEIVFLNVVLNNGAFQEKIFQMVKNQEATSFECSFLNIYLNSIDEHLFYEGNLLEYGISWSFGASEILVYDYRLQLNSNILLEFAKTQMADGEYYVNRDTSSYRQNYLCAATKVSMQKLPYSKLTNTFYIADILKHLIEGKVHELERSKKQLMMGFNTFEKLGEVKFWDFEFREKFCDLNNSAFNIIPVTNTLIAQTKFGFFEIRTDKYSLWSELGYLLDSNDYYAAKTSVIKNFKSIELGTVSSFLCKGITAFVESHQNGKSMMTPAQNMDICFSFLREGLYRGRFKKQLTVPDSGFYIFELSFDSKNLERISFFNVEIQEHRFKNSGSKRDMINLNKNSNFRLITYLEAGDNTVNVFFTTQTKNKLDLRFSLELVELIKYWEVSVNQMRIEEGSLLPENDNLCQGGEVLCTEVQLYKIDHEMNLFLGTRSKTFPTHVDLENRTIFAYSTSHNYSELLLSFNFDLSLIKNIRSYTRIKEAKVEWVESYAGGVAFSLQKTGLARFKVALSELIPSLAVIALKFETNFDPSVMEYIRIITPDDRVLSIDSSLSLEINNPALETYEFLVFEFQLKNSSYLGKHLEMNLVRQEILEKKIKWIEHQPSSVKFETNKEMVVEGHVPLEFFAFSNQYVGNKIVSYQPFSSTDEFEITHLGANVSTDFLIHVHSNYIEIFPRQDVRLLAYSDEFKLKFKVKAQSSVVYGLERHQVKLVRPSEEYYRYQNVKGLDSIELYPGFHKLVLFFNHTQTTDIQLNSKNKNVNLPIVHIEDSSEGVYEVYVPSHLEQVKLSTNVEIAKVDHLFYPANE